MAERKFETSGHAKRAKVVQTHRLAHLFSSAGARGHTSEKHRLFAGALEKEQGHGLEQYEDRRRAWVFVFSGGMAFNLSVALLAFSALVPLVNITHFLCCNFFCIRR